MTHSVIACLGLPLVLAACAAQPLDLFGESDATVTPQLSTERPTSTLQTLSENTVAGSHGETGPGPLPEDTDLFRPIGTDVSTYAPILGDVARATAEIGGVFRLQSVDDAVQHVARGVLDPASRRLEMRIGSQTFLDEDGFDAKGEAVDASGVFLTLLEGPPESRFGALYRAQDGAGRTDLTGVGVIGVTTRDDDLPLSGGAVYRGVADLGIRSDAAIAFAATGSIKAEVDFKAGEVALLARVAQASDPVTGAKVSDPVYDAFFVEGMTITQARFRGGTAFLLKDGAQVFPLGNISGGSHQGSFFGAVDLDDGKRKPAEIGGGSILKGAEGTAYLTYLGRIVDK